MPFSTEHTNPSAEMPELPPEREPRRKPHGWRRAGRIAVRVLAGLVVLVVVLGLGAYGVLHTGWGKELVRTQLQKTLAGLFAGEVKVGGVEGNVIGDIVLTDLSIADADGKPAITAKRLAVDFSILPFVGSTVRVDSIRADGLVVSGRERADGTLNLATLMKPQEKKEESGWSVHLDDVAIPAAKIAIEYRDPTKSIHLDAVNLIGAVDLSPDEGVHATIAVDGRWRERASALQATAELAQMDDRVDVRVLYARLGDIEVAARDLHVRGTRVEGTAVVIAPEADIQRFAPTARVGGDVAMRVQVLPLAGENELGVMLRGSAGRASLDAHLAVDLDEQARRVRGWLRADHVDAHAFQPTVVPTDVAAFVAVDATQRPSQSKDDKGVLVAFADVHVRGTSAGGGRVLVDGAVHMDEHGVVRLENGHVIARAADLARASGGAAPVQGSAEVDLRLSGRVAGGDGPELAAAGSVRAANLVQGTTRVRSVAIDFETTGLPASPAGRVHGEIAGIVDRGRPAGMVVLDARSRPDRAILVTARSIPRAGPWIVDLDALVRVGDTTTVALNRHRLRTKGVDWSGRGGLVTIAPERISLAGLRTTVAGGSLAVDASLERAGARTGDLEATVGLDHLSLAEIDRSFGVSEKLGPGHALSGTIDARVAVKRTRGRWAAQLGARAEALRVRQDASPVNASIEARTDPKGQLAVEASLRGPGVGALSMSIDVDAPRDVTNPVAWNRLERHAIRRGRFTLENLDLARLAALVGIDPPATGRLHGEMTLSATRTEGTLHAHDLLAPGMPAPVDAVLNVARSEGDAMQIGLDVTLRGITRAHAKAEVAVPERTFDAAAWAALGPEDVHGVQVVVDDVVLDAERSRRLGLVQPWFGRAGARLEVTAGLAAVHATIDARGVRGGPLAVPFDAHFETTVDAEGTRWKLTGSQGGRQVLDSSGHAPLTLARLMREGAAAVMPTPVVASLTVDQLPIRTLRPNPGVDMPVTGTINVNARVMGTLGAPTGRARIVLSGVGATSEHAAMRELRVDASFDGKAIHAEARGEQADGGTLHAIADAEIARMTAVQATLQARHFDLAPLEYLAPTSLLGVAGILDANLKLAGGDQLTAGRVSGTLKLSKARLPIGGTIGTLRHATVTLLIEGEGVQLDARGQVGEGELTLDGRAKMEGLLPSYAEANLVLRRISLISEAQPRISGKVKVNARREGELWNVEVRVRDTAVVVPEEKGNKLHAAGAPADMVIIENGKPPPARAEPEGLQMNIGERPDKPLMVAKIDLGPTTVNSKELRAVMRGKLTVEMSREALWIGGEIATTRGDVDLFDRRYRIDHAQVRFDGGVDPGLDVRVVYEFPQLTLYADVRGRVSKPELHLSSEPGTYTEGQLLSFLLGGNPGAEPGEEIQEAATGVASSLVSQKVGGYLEKVLPVDLDVLRFEAATANSSAAFTIGKWITRKLFLAYRRRLEARPDENGGEAELEYWLGTNVLLEATAGDRGIYGADLLWLRRW